ncbi:hypothetical protein NPIL_254221 [Nephila pilipes]|uniref:Uncharacterized protein n=1 Tax=Nephila pilipes TaxID=299642 RepID=A0A8X6MYW9_NEPPI|nr:hypothetical protein NPIL_254221 [Nephila pilipes]
MAYLARGNKLDLLEICEEIGVEVNPSSKVAEIKKLILNSQLYVEVEVKIILDRVISDRKKQERISREAKQEQIAREEKQERIAREEKQERIAREDKQHELEMKKLEL